MATETKAKSDVKAKDAFIKELFNRQRDVYAFLCVKSHFQQANNVIKIKESPLYVDVEATINEEDWYFEIKKTAKDDKIFGAATLTEWKKAFEDPERFRFVIAKEKNDGGFTFKCFTPKEFMDFSVIPPSKIYFNIRSENNNYVKTKRRKETIKFTEERFNSMLKLYVAMKEDQIEHN